MINPGLTLHRDRLGTQIAKSRTQLEPFRRKRIEMIKEYAGSSYAGAFAFDDTESRRQKIYVNLMNYAAETYAMILAANNPQVDVTTRYTSLKRFGRIFTTATNNLIREMRLNEVIQECVVDAFFSLGISKVYLADSGLVQLEGIDEFVDPGKPYVERLSMDDWFHDPAAENWRRIAFSGDKYRVPFEKLKDPIYNQKAVKGLQPSRSDRSGTDGERVSDMSDNESPAEFLEDSIWLMDVWLPSRGTVVTWPWLEGGNKIGEPLAEREMDGPEGGPYELLQFSPVPDNLMPAGLAGNIRNLGQLANSLWARLANQAKREKIIGLTDNAEDAEKIRDTRDGGIVRVANADSVIEKKFGGISGANNAFLMQVDQAFSKAGGNLDAISGQGAQTETLGQERLVQGAVSQRTARLVEGVKGFTERIIRKVGSMMWNDQIMEIPGVYTPPGTSVELQSNWEPGVREGDFHQYNFNVDVYSMAHRSPQEKVSVLERVIVELILPMAPMLQQQGGSINYQELITQLSKLHNLPEIEDIVKFDMPQPTQEGPVGGAPRAAGGGGPTTREYVRRSAGGGNQQQMAQLMATMGSGPGE